LDDRGIGVQLAWPGHLPVLEAERRVGDVFELREQETANERQVPKLRERLKRPETYLAIAAVFVLAVAAESLRPAEHQFSARAYVGLVGIYQLHISPSMRSYVRCRYRPTCSEYSRQAVARHGLLTGFRRSIARTLSCQSSVPLGTLDPVP
jgi:putative membrane protein insertion efficiency factor